MGAKVDFSVAIEMFKEQFQRDPRPTEMLNIKNTQAAVLALAGAADYCELWDEHVAQKIEITADGWDEFAMMGCLDREVQHG